ncbi:hypothetical protein [Parasitella parasitica]|uniref:Uncharacterized protein n=1 Tax=Parasitella parasitica TaxID=35722 RepID=A0A0B7NDF4_9FUNG|nr:hypothetical protein [Parasitella parasitica]
MNRSGDCKERDGKQAFAPRFSAQSSYEIGSPYKSDSLIEKLDNARLSRALPSSLPDAHKLPGLDLYGKPSDMVSLQVRGRKLQYVIRKKNHYYDFSDMLCSFNQLIEIP